MRQTNSFRSAMSLTCGIFLAMLLAAAGTQPAYAGLPEGNGSGHGKHGRSAEARHGRHAEHSGYFSAREIGTIRAYYGGRGQGLPPGLAKRGGNLPPGLEKHLERDGTLPPGLQKRLTPIPYDLERELPPLPRDCGCRRGVLGPNVLILNDKTGRILDIIQDVAGLVGR